MPRLTEHEPQEIIHCINVVKPSPDKCHMRRLGWTSRKDDGPAIISLKMSGRVSELRRITLWS